MTFPIALAGDFRAIMQLDASHGEALHKFFRCAWWANDRTLEQTRSIIENSSISIGILNAHGQLAGFSRVLTDFTVKALVLDVIVSEQHRGRGLGAALMQLVLGHEKLSAVRDFELYCRPEMRDFYRRWGFSDDIPNLHFMRRRR